MRTANLSLVLIAVMGSSTEGRDWTAIRLHPDGYVRSGVAGITPFQQAGGGEPPGLTAVPQPLLWSGSNSAWVNLSPSPSMSGGVRGMDATHQVGYLAGHASLWSGTAASRIDLNPAGAAGSIAYAIGGDEQVGTWSPASGGGFAALWRGSASSFVNLHPAGALSSDANATDGQLQGGRIVTPGDHASHAALWAGSAASFADLNPAGAIGSEIEGMSPGQQVGYTQFASSLHHGALWAGSPASYVDLNPPGAAGSILFGTCGVAQVGYIDRPGFGQSAGIWFGTPDSFMSLQPYVPPGYSNSAAFCIAEQGDVFYIGGFAVNDSTGNSEAFMWVGTVPAPGATILLPVAIVCIRRRHRYV